MKSKLMAGVVATLISLVVLIGLAILIVAVFDTEPTDGMTKIAAFLIIGIWAGIYMWLRPKGTPTFLEKLENKTKEKQKQIEEAKAYAEAKKSGTNPEEKKERNSYH